MNDDDDPLEMPLFGGPTRRSRSGSKCGSVAGIMSQARMQQFNHAVQSQQAPPMQQQVFDMVADVQARVAEIHAAPAMIAAAAAPDPVLNAINAAQRVRPRRGKCWCFTLHIKARNRPDYEGRPPLVEGMDYICAQTEKCPETGRLHWQGYCEMARLCTLVDMKTVFTDDVHWEMRRGSQTDAIEYTKKAESAVEGTWFECGQKHAPDATKLLAAAADAVAVGIQVGQDSRTIMRKIAETLPTAIVLYHRGLDNLHSLLSAAPPTFRKVECFLYWGDAGTGKTRKVHEENPGIYIKSLDEYWDAYCGQASILFDDFYGGHQVSHMLRWMDGYPVPLNRKCKAPVDAMWSKVFFTSNMFRDEWWAKANLTTEVRNAIKRRLPDENCILFRRAPEPVNPFPAMMAAAAAANGKLVEEDASAMHHFNTYDRILDDLRADPPPQGSGPT